MKLLQSQTVQLISNTILDSVFPKQCVGCRAYDVWMCERCIRQNLNIEHVVMDETVHQSTGIHSITTLGEYRNPFWRNAVGLLKFQRIQEVAEICAHLLVETDSISGGILVPIPLHKKRLRERGFNQAELMAQHISEQTDAKILPNLLRRTTHTQSQTTVGHHERARNIHNVFSMNTLMRELVHGQTVLLIDDVITTGATIIEAASLIQQSNPTSIDVVGIARGHSDE